MDVCGCAMYLSSCVQVCVHVRASRGQRPGRWFPQKISSLFSETEFVAGSVINSISLGGAPASPLPFPSVWVTEIFRCIRLFNVSAGNCNSVFCSCVHTLYQLRHLSKPQESKIFTNIDAYAMNITSVEMLIGLDHVKNLQKNCR